MRIGKLSNINKIIEQLAVQKRMEAERAADLDYNKNTKIGGRSPRGDINNQLSSAKFRTHNTPGG